LPRCRQRSERAVISLWRDLASAHALDQSPTDRATVAEIAATGFILGPSTIDVLEVEQILLDQAALGPEESGAGKPHADPACEFARATCSTASTGSQH
jgi:hypothetical protein